MKYIEDSKHKLVYVAMLTSGVPIRIIGDVYVGEIILALYGFDLLVSKQRVFVNKYFSKIPILMILWLIANFFSSIANYKDFRLSLVSIFTVLISFCAIFSMLGFVKRNPSKFIYLALTFVAGRIFGVFLFPNNNSTKLFWKFGVGEWVILLVIVLMFSTRKTFPFSILLLGFGMFSFLNEARTLGFLTVLTIFVLLPKFRESRKVGLVSLLLFFLLPIVYFGYILLASHNILGYKEYERSQVLATSDIGPLAARTEFVFSSKAFLTSPLYGYGFEPQVNRRIIIDGYQWLSDRNVIVSSQIPGNLPMHSFLMSALVQGGIFAGFFWFATLVYVVQCLVSITRHPNYSRALVFYSCSSLIDRILFSPYGAYERLNFAFYITTLFTLISDQERDN